jgi:hypothetical protein
MMKSAGLFLSLIFSAAAVINYGGRGFHQEN